MLQFDTNAVYRMAALQSSAGRELLPCCGRRPDDISSIVLVEPEGCFVKRCAQLSLPTHFPDQFPHNLPIISLTFSRSLPPHSPDSRAHEVLKVCIPATLRSEAVLRIASRLSIPLQLLGGLAKPLPLFVRDAVYDQIADNRYNLFGKSDSCR